jgi:pyrroline-5-carboxylate reductase
MQILLIGYGAMGSALLKGWEPFHRLTVVDPFKEGCAKSLEDLPPTYAPDVIVIAVKPQMLAEVMPAYAKFSHALFISIAAGIKSERYLTWLGTKIRVSRVMPNLPVLVAQGASAYVLNENCTVADDEIIRDLFEKVGLVEKLPDENLFDAVTALSGSGPAYVYYLCECLEQAAVELGLDRQFCQRFARQTIIGAAATLKELPPLPAELRTNVTSKGGTTEAALGILMQGNQLQTLFSTALKAAHKRAQELAL